ncbi:MAG: pilus assembly protein TadG-related protein [Nitrospinota bacterium]
MGEATKSARRRGEAGNALVLFALMLPVLMGFAALAVDVGYLYYVRTAMQATADAACLAGGSGLVVSQGEAKRRATAIGDQNIAQMTILSNSDHPTTLAVSFPSDDDLDISTTVSNPTMRLFFARVLGWTTAPVSATATCGLTPATHVARDLIPLAVVCTPTNNCQTFLQNMLNGNNPETLRRYCGNFYVSGNGDACGNAFTPDEVFLMGIALGPGNVCNYRGEDNVWVTMSNATFRDLVYNGYKGTTYDDNCALPGNRNGWQSGMYNRLLEERNEVIIPVVKQDPQGYGGRQVQIIEFVAITINYFGEEGNTDHMTFTVTETTVSPADFAPPADGTELNSVMVVRLLE